MEIAEQEPSNMDYRCWQAFSHMGVRECECIYAGQIGTR